MERFQPIRLVDDREFVSEGWGVVDTQGDFHPFAKKVPGAEKEKVFTLVRSGLNQDHARLLADGLNREVSDVADTGRSS